MKRAALGSVLLALGILVAGPAPLALAHTDLILSTPEDGSRIATVPDVVDLAFSEDLLPETVVVSVEDSAGMVVRVLEFEVDGSDVVVAWPPGLSGADYTVNYRVVSQDGHPVSGSLSFTVENPPSAVAAAAPASAAPASATAVPDPAASGSSAAPVAAIAAGLGVGIAVGFLYLITRRRRGAGSPDAPGPDSTP